MNKTRIITGMLTAALIAASFAGCGEKFDETQDVSALKQGQGQRQEQKAPHDRRDKMAKVVSLNGDQLTVILADMPNLDGDGSTPPAMRTPPDGNGSASGPAIDGSEAPAREPGQPGQPGHVMGKIQFTGDQTAYTLSKDVAVMKGVGDSATEIDLSELKPDDVIRFTTVTDDNGNETIDTIVVLE